MYVMKCLHYCRKVFKISNISKENLRIQEEAERGEKNIFDKEI